MSIDTSNIKFSYLENGPNLDKTAMALRKEIYDLWYPQWTEIYKSWNSTNVPNFRDFLLYNYIHCISVNNEIAAISAHRLLNLEEPLNDNLEYFQSFGPENIQKLYSMGLRQILTIESLLVAPTYRKKQSDFQLAKVLLYLANETFSISLADGIVGTARKDVKVPELSFSVGYEVVEANREVRTIPCDVVLQRNRQVRHFDDPAWVLSQRLWKQRRIHLSSPYINIDLIVQKKHAA